jgi:hypothetical protein
MSKKQKRQKEKQWVAPPPSPYAISKRKRRQRVQRQKEAAKAVTKSREEKVASRDWKHLAWEPGGKPPVELQDLQAEKQAFCGFYQKNAVERNLCFELTLAQFVEICEQGCHYCLSQPKRWPKQLWTHHGIDRKDNRVGYVLSNCLPCCSFCNRAKGAAPYDEFLAYLARVVKNRQDLGNRPSKIRPQPSKIGPQQVSLPDLFKAPWGRRF